MKPVMQTKFGENNNSWRACVASLLEMELDDLPRWEHNYVSHRSAWFEKHGLTVVAVDSEGFAFTHGFAFGSKKALHIVTGVTGLGEQQSVVVFDDVVQHHPHPEAPELFHILRYAYIVPMDISVALPLREEPAMKLVHRTQVG